MALRRISSLAVLIVMTWCFAVRVLGAPAVISGTWRGAKPDMLSLLAASPTSNRVVASYGATVLLSDDSGTTWQAAAQGLGGATPRAFVTSASGAIFALSNSASDVYRLSSGATTWTKVLNGYVRSLAVDPTGQILGAVIGRALYRSLDGGSSWALLVDPVPVGDPGYVNGLAVADRDTFLIADYMFDVHRTADAGATFSSATGLPGSSPSAVLIDRTNPSRVFVQTYAVGVYRSLDGGSTWNSSSTGLPGGLPGVPAGGGGGATGLFQGPDGAVYVLVSGGTGLYRSSNGGDTWENANAGLALPERYACSEIAFGTGDKVYGAFGLWGLRVRLSGASAWSRVDTGRTHGAPPYARCLTVDSGGRVFCGVNGAGVAPYNGTGIFVSEDGGSTWFVTGSDVEDLDVNGLASDGAGSTYASSYWFKVTRTVDGGRAWPRPGTFAFPSSPTQLLATDDRVLAGTYWDGVWESSDRGVTWRGLPNPGGGASLIAQTAEGRLNWLSADQSGSRGVVRLTAAGDSWESNNSGIPTATQPLLRGIGAGGSGALYAWATGGVLYRQASAAANWEMVPLPATGNVTAVTRSPTGGTLVGTSGLGVLHRNEQTGVWEKVGDTRVDALSVDALAAAPDGTIYAGTNAGVYSFSAATFATGVPAFTTWPASTSVYAGANAVLSCAVTANPAPSFRWQYSTDAGLTWSDVPAAAPFSGVTTATLTIAAANTGMDGYQFKCVVSNSAGSATSSVSTLTVVIRLAITGQPPNMTVTAGQSATFSVAAIGQGTLNYQWRRNGFPITGATVASLALASASRSDADYYDVVVTDATGASVASQQARLSVAPTAYPTLVAPDPAWDLRPEAPGGVGRVMVSLSDGRAYLAGEFTSIDGARRSGLARITVEGALDSSFTPPEVDNPVRALAVQSDGRIIIGGDFVHIGGVVHNHIARLNIDGSVDSEFDAGTGVSSTVNALAVQTDGRILVGGASRLARLNADGTRDTSYSPLIGGSVLALAVRSDGSALVGGSFRSVNGIICNAIVRLGVDGTLDRAFAGGASLNGDVSVVAIQGDGRTIIGGTFTTYGSSTIGCLARFNSDGSLDQTFASAAGTGFGFHVNAVAIQGDGRILVGGSFDSFNGTTALRFVRLNTDGTRDTEFSTLGFDGSVLAVALQSGKPVVAGFFGGYLDRGGLKTPRSFFARLNADGTLDSGVNFVVRTKGLVFDELLLPEGKTLIAGFFSMLRGATLPAGVARINADGTVDNTFNSGGSGTDSTVNAAALQPDGKIIITGSFNTYNGASAHGIARLNSDGSRDTGFSAVPPFSIIGDNGRTLALRPGGSIIVGGNFTSNGSPTRKGITALNPDGSPDTSFDPGTGANATVYGSAMQADGKVVLVGSFTTFNGAASGRIVRLSADGSLDSGFNVGSGANQSVFSVVILPDGKLVIGGQFSSFDGSPRSGVARLNSDGTLDTSFVPVAMGDIVHSVLGQEDGRVFVFGPFTSVGGAAGSAYLARLNVDGTLDATFAAIGMSPANIFRSELAMRDGGQLFFTTNSFASFSATRPVAFPVITVAPQPATITLGDSVTFEVSASSALPVSYQWLFEGLSIAGAKSTTLTLSNVLPANSGSYSVVVASELGSTTSGAAILTVTVPPAPPAITSQPSGQTVNAGDPVTFTVLATGNPAPGYQWRKGGVPLNNATNATLTLTNVQPIDSGGYDVVVSNGLSPDVISDVAVLNVVPAGTSAAQASLSYAPNATGGTFSISNRFTYSGAVTNVRWSVVVPPGWSFANGDASGTVLQPEPGAMNLLEWRWSTSPASPVVFAYSLNLPAGDIAPQSLAALVNFNYEGTPIQILARPDPLMIGVRHTADTDRNGSLGLTELLRVIELYNTRNGTVRTGAYSVDPTNLEDGFSTDPTRSTTAAVRLTRYHTADTGNGVTPSTPPDGKIELTELLRVIELYNHRTGTARDGLYHVEVGTEDGFAAGAGASLLSATPGTTAEFLIGGPGDDILIANQGPDTLTGGAGANTFVIALPGANLNTHSTITDAKVGDKLQLKNKGNETFNAFRLVLPPTAVFQDYADSVAAMGGDASTNGAVGWFQFNSDTYVVESMHNGATTPAFTNNVDLIVKILGLVNLSNSTLQQNSSGTPEVVIR